MKCTICSCDNTSHINPPFLFNLDLSHYKGAIETEYRYFQAKDDDCFLLMSKLLLYNVIHTANSTHYMQSVSHCSVFKIPHQGERISIHLKCYFIGCL